jgi:hypothetical protein
MSTEYILFTGFCLVLLLLVHIARQIERLIILITKQNQKSRELE